MRRLPGYLLLASLALAPADAGMAQDTRQKAGYELLPSKEVFRFACRKPYMMEEVLHDGKPKIAACYEEGKSRSCFKNALKRLEGDDKITVDVTPCLADSAMLLYSSRGNGIYDVQMVNPRSSCSACHKKKIEI